MAASQAVARPVLEGVPAEASPARFGPIHFLYTFLHEAFRWELEQLEALLAPGAETGSPDWRQLLRRYAFVRDVYKYHSSAEDEVRGWWRVSAAVSWAGVGAQGCGWVAGGMQGACVQD